MSVSGGGFYSGSSITGFTVSHCPLAVSLPEDGYTPPRPPDDYLLALIAHRPSAARVHELEADLRR
jgi:hypothetical protein